HTAQEVFHVIFALLGREYHFGGAELLLELLLRDPLGRDGDVIHFALELPARHHHNRALVAADQARDVLAVRHRGTQHERVALREFGDQVEGVRHLALVLEDVDAARGHDLVRELRLAPADVERRDDVIEQVGRNAARVVPVLAEAEETVCVVRALRRRTEPHVPVNVIVALPLRAGVLSNRPVPFALDRIAVVRPLAHQQLSDHAVLDRLAGLPPLIARSRLRADLDDTVGSFGGLVKTLRLLDRFGHRLFAVDILARLHRLNRNRRMPVVGGRDDHDVNVLARDHFAVIEGGELGLALLFGLVQALAVNVADGDDLGRAGAGPDLHRPAHHGAAAPADADATDVDPVIRAEDAPGRKHLLALALCKGRSRSVFGE